MSDNTQWKSTLNEYLKQGEPDQIEKTEIWKTAIGLQDVDGLKTSDYLLDTARENIEGKIDIDTAGIGISNSPFEDHSWYFRNAPVRANYNNFDQDIYETTEYPERFFSSIILNTDYELHNADLRIKGKQ